MIHAVLSSRRSLLRRARLPVFVQVVPLYVIAGSGQTPPSERIRVAAIGCADAPSQYRGRGRLWREIVGLRCRHAPHRQDAYKILAAAIFKDYRHM
jgi:hypothetical protein